LCLSQHAIDGIQTTKARINALFQHAQHEINSWADIPDFNQTVGDTFAANPPPAAQHSAPANLGVHHFQGNCAASSSDASLPSPAAGILDDLVKLLEAEGDTFKNAAQAIKTDIVDKFSSLSATDIIKKLLAIIADTLLQSVENVLLALLDVCAKLMEGVIGILTKPLDIPVLSWLYKDLTGDDLTFLDLICLIAAIPVTIVYKLTERKTPFPEKDAFTQGLLKAESFADIQKLFIVSQQSVGTAPRGSAPMLQAGALESGDVLDQAKLKTFGFVTGIVSLCGAVALVVVTNVQRTEPDGGFPKWLQYTLATLAAASNAAYVSPNFATLVNAKTDNWYADLNNAVTLLSILKGLVGIPLAIYVNEPKSITFGLIETGMNIIWNIPVIANIMVNQKAANTTYKSLIPESIGNFAFNLGGTLEAPITILLPNPDPDEKIALAVLIAGQAVLMVTYGVCMVVAGDIYDHPDQHH
jgi:hypothetical protein